MRTWTAKLAHPIASTKSYLFQVARNLAIDAVRQKLSAPTESLVDLDARSVLEDGADIVADLGRQEKIDLLTAALTTLPERTREIVFLRKFQSMPQRQVAAWFGVSERTVETQLAKGMKRCADYLRKRGVHGFYRDESPASNGLSITGSTAAARGGLGGAGRRHGGSHARGTPPLPLPSPSPAASRADWCGGGADDRRSRLVFIVRAA